MTGGRSESGGKAWTKVVVSNRCSHEIGRDGEKERRKAPDRKNVSLKES